MADKRDKMRDQNKGKTVMCERSEYIEQYVNQSGFRILNAMSEAGGFMFILVKD